jgi:hypothetical protein
VDETRPARGTAFIETDLTRQIFATCRQAFVKGRFTFIFGESQIGKTSALSEYAQRHGQTVLARVPAGGGMHHFLAELSVRVGMSPNQSATQCRRRITECFDSKTLLIVDEAHQFFMKRSGIEVLEFLRGIHDTRGCGLVLCGTNALKAGMARSSAADVLRQIWRRKFAPLQLPNRPSAKILEQFAAAFNLDPAPNKNMTVSHSRTNIETGEDETRSIVRNPFLLQEEIITSEGLGTWVRTLEAAKEFAEEKQRKITWGAVITAAAMTEALGNLDNLSLR